jgi:hypothetical protein
LAVSRPGAIGHQETFGLAFQFPANESVTPVFF